MKFTIIKQWILFFLLTGMSILQAQNPDYYFDLANRAYADGKYEDAIEMYLSIINEGMESGEVYFNLGNAHYKANQVGLGGTLMQLRVVVAAKPQERPPKLNLKTQASCSGFHLSYHLAEEIAGLFGVFRFLAARYTTLP